MSKAVVLSSRERDRMESEIADEIAARIGSPPTLSALESAGMVEHSTTRKVLDTIDSVGRVITLFVAETVQSVAAIVIAVVFAVLEYQRVYNGSLALGQTGIYAQWIAVAVVSANFIVPIYILRTLRGRNTHEIVRPTLKSMFFGVYKRIAGDARRDVVDWTHNPTLQSSKLLITWTTVFLAVYDLIAPLLTSILDGSATKPPLILTIELLMGLGLSVAGVFFLQSAAHEIGVRTLTDRPAAVADVLAAERARYNAAVLEIRNEVRERYENAKAARQDATPAAVAVLAKPDVLAADPKPETADFLPSPVVSTNGNGHHQNGAKNGMNGKH